MYRKNSIVQKNLSKIQIQKYFEDNRELFAETFATRVRLEDFAEKISRHAIHFCALHAGELVGLLACYFNHPSKEFGYITSLSVIKEFQGKGIAHLLMNEVIDYGKRNGFSKIRMEVREVNKSGIALYRSLGFHTVEKNEVSQFMELSI